MKNYEKYENELREYDGSNFCDDFIIPHVFNSETHCKDMNCAAYHMLQVAWLFKEYEEPKESEVDWNHIKLDTPILVRQNENSEWVEGYFANYDNETETIYTWKSGGTSWTTYEMDKWQYAKLIEYEEHEKPEIDWNKVEVDTPILVRDWENREWGKRYFAKYENGVVYTWYRGYTSWVAEGEMEDWRYAKLAEGEESAE